jgi:hypothetical protein
VNVAFSLIELEHTGQAVFEPYFCKLMKTGKIEFSLWQDPPRRRYAAPTRADENGGT